MNSLAYGGSIEKLELTIIVVVVVYQPYKSNQFSQFVKSGLTRVSCWDQYTTTIITIYFNICMESPSPKDSIPTLKLIIIKVVVVYQSPKITQTWLR